MTQVERAARDGEAVPQSLIITTGEAWVAQERSLLWLVAFHKNSHHSLLFFYWSMYLKNAETEQGLRTGFIVDEEAWVAQERASDGDALLFATAQFEAAFADGRLEAVGHSRDRCVQLCHVDSDENVFVRCLRAPVPAEHSWLLSVTFRSGFFSV